MIDFKTNQIKINGFWVSIDHWEVWFRTMLGLHHNLGEALDCATQIDTTIRPEFLIEPVSVAIGTNGDYEVAKR